jgi:hypothetical protein
MNKFQSVNITGAGTSVIAKDQSLLGIVTINKASAQTITIYDGQDATGKVLLTLPASAAVGSYHYFIECQKGITVVAAASYAGDCTVSFV